MHGPEKLTREQRMHIARDIAGRLREVHGAKLKAVGVYGSLARGTDGPFSDIEMFCVLYDSDASYFHEWCTGAWKAEVDVYGEEILLKKAATVKGTWPLTHGKYFTVLPLHDPDGFFPGLRRAAESPPDEEFARAIRDLLTEELFELAGKWRNAALQGPASFLPSLAVKAAECGAMLIGLHHRFYYTTAAQVLPEALRLPDLPDRYDTLARLVMEGTLSDPETVAYSLEAFWSGVLAWAKDHGYGFIEPESIPF